MQETILSVLRDVRLQTLLALIVLDLLLGVAAALRNGTFKWEEVGRFYKTTVGPIFLGYAAIRLTLPYISSGLLGDQGQWITEVGASLFWVAGVGTLLASIKDSILALGVVVPVDDEDG